MTNRGENTEEMKTPSDQKEHLAENETIPPEESSADSQKESPESSSPEIAALTEKLSAEKDRILRLSAEFENYKKRKQREIDDFKKFANETVFKQLLSVVDNLERAIAAAAPNQETGAGLLSGVELIHKEILTIFENFHVRPVEAQDQPFDPNFHQAVIQEEADHLPDKTVIRVMQKGYSFHDRLLRPAMVAVSKKPAAESQNADKE